MKKMKKLLLVLAIGTFAACAGENKEVSADSAAVVADTAAVAPVVDSAAATVDTAAKAAVDTTKK
ncbi:MAG: hypothetical protein EAZ62_00410 [Sphingobacteriia bacterium]|nr:MAG: hypothetical protein EAZ62_00410 [Sphingobacteriia bacterium]